MPIFSRRVPVRTPCVNRVPHLLGVHSKQVLVVCIRVVLRTGNLSNRGTLNLEALSLPCLSVASPLDGSGPKLDTATRTRRHIRRSNKLGMATTG